MKKSRILLVCALILSLVLCALPLVTSAETPALPEADPVSVWDGTCDTTALSTDPDGAYLIQSADDLAFFVASVNGGTNYWGKTVKLTTDITWNEGDASAWTATTTGLKTWTPIGDWSHPFRGTFDGQGHTLSGLYFSRTANNCGVFGVGTGGTYIKNLIVKNTAFFFTGTGSSNMGGLVGVVRGGLTTIENVTVSATVDSGKGTYAGGIAAVLWQNENGTLTIKNCVFDGVAKTTANYAGGIVGCLGSGAGVLTITDCLNLGSVSSQSYSGGILGGFEWTTRNQTLTVTGCVNLGTVADIRTDADTDGGIFGNKPDSKFTLQNNLYSTDGSQGIGGNPATLTGNTGKTSAEIKAMTTNGLAAAGLTNWEMGKNGYPVPKSAAAQMTATVKVAAAVGLEGKTLEADAFTLQLFAANDAFEATGDPLATKKNTSDGLVDFGSFALPEGTHRYILKQVKGTVKGIAYDETEYQTTVTVDAFGNIMSVTVAKKGDTAKPTSFAFKNVYTVAANSLNLTANVSVDGRKVKAEEFSFELYKANDNTFALAENAAALKIAKNDAEGAVYFTEADEYTAVGTYYYVLKQTDTAAAGITEDLTVYHITVTVTDNNGTLKAVPVATKAGTTEAADLIYKNAYKAAPVSVPFAAVTEMAGKDLSAEEFTYVIYETGETFEVKGDPVKTAKNAADGSVAFGNVTYDKAGTYYYVLRQNASASSEITSDASEYRITVAVTDNGDGKLTAAVTAVKKDEGKVETVLFKNTYTPAKLSVSTSGASVYDGTKSTKLRTENQGKTVYIDSAADLAYFADQVTNGNGYAGKTVLLTTDIIWNRGDAAAWAAGSEIPKYIWSCGAWNKFFQGTFDGQGHTISGLYNKSDKDNIGFINGVGGTAAIKNLVIINSAFICSKASGAANIGGLVGVMGERAKLTVETVYVDANVVAPAAENAGGLVGRVHNGLCELTISDAVFAGTVSGKKNVGGIVAFACVNNNEAGTSTNIKITDTVNMGSVSGETNVAGFVGYNENGQTVLTRCVNTGAVTGDKNAAFFGTGKVDATMKDCYYTDSSAKVATNAGKTEGVTAVSTAVLVGDKAKETLKGFTFSSEWKAIAAKYPMPTSVYKMLRINPGTSDWVLPTVAGALMAVAAAAAIVIFRRKKAANEE